MRWWSSEFIGIRVHDFKVKNKITLCVTRMNESVSVFLFCSHNLKTCLVSGVPSPSFEGVCRRTQAWSLLRKSSTRKSYPREVNEQISVSVSNLILSFLVEIRWELIKRKCKVSQTFSHTRNSRGKELPVCSWKKSPHFRRRLDFFLNKKEPLSFWNWIFSFVNIRHSNLFILTAMSVCALLIYLWIAFT